MKTKFETNRRGFTLIEILVVIGIIAVLASILIPAAGHARRSALKRRAMVEMNSIKVAVMEFYNDHKYMPWPSDPEDPKVGSDMWTGSEDQQEGVMELLTGNNFLQKAYLQIPEKSRPASKRLLFLDPWSGKENNFRYYVIGMDRNMDGVVLPDDFLGGGAAYVKEKVLVYSKGDPEEDKDERDRILKTFDVITEE
ncbi:MAG: type II secretion system protein [Kiritimatiellia bacterium]